MAEIGWGFYEDFRVAEDRRRQAAAQVIEQVAKANETAKAPPPPPPLIIRQKSIDGEPVGGSPPPPPLQQSYPSRIEVDLGLVKVAMNNEESWSAIFKMIALVLLTFFGVRLINFGFKRFEGASA